LDGEIAKGKHEALISEEIFLKANDMLKGLPMDISTWRKMKISH
jgi:hypothetical protein